MKDKSSIKRMPESFMYRISFFQNLQISGKFRVKEIVHFSSNHEIGGRIDSQTITISKLRNILLRRGNIDLVNAEGFKFSSVTIFEKTVKEY